MRSRLADARLLDIADKLDAGVRLDLADGVRLFDTPDLLAVGWLATAVSTRADSTFPMVMSISPVGVQAGTTTECEISARYKSESCKQ